MRQFAFCIAEAVSRYHLRHKNDSYMTIIAQRIVCCSSVHASIQLILQYLKGLTDAEAIRKSSYDNKVPTQES